MNRSMRTECNQFTAEGGRITAPSRAWWGAVMACSAALVTAGAGYRTLSPLLQTVRGDVSAPAGFLRNLPQKIETWSGRDVPLDERVVRATDTDDHLNRVYSRDGTAGTVALYIAFGIRLRDLAPHRPEVCYPSSGWTMEDERTIRFTDTTGATREAVLHRFRRGVLEPERIEVISYYNVGGLHYPNVDALRTAWWRASSRGSFSAQIQIVASAGQLGGDTDAALEFAALSAGPIAEVLAQATGTGPSEQH